VSRRIRDFANGRSAVEEGYQGAGRAGRGPRRDAPGLATPGGQRRGPGRQRPRPSWRGRRYLLRQAPDRGAGAGLAQVSAAGDDPFLYRVTQVLPQLKAVSDLDGVRGSLPGAVLPGCGPGSDGQCLAGGFLVVVSAWFAWVPSWLKLVRTGLVVDAVEGLALVGRQGSAARGWASAICSQAPRRNCAGGQAWSLANAATCVTPVVITPGHQQDVARRAIGCRRHQDDCGRCSPWRSSSINRRGS
jgi:hypothetical protein